MGRLPPFAAWHFTSNNLLSGCRLKALFSAYTPQVGALCWMLRLMWAGPRAACSLMVPPLVAFGLVGCLLGLSQEGVAREMRLQGQGGILHQFRKLLPTAIVSIYRLLDTKLQTLCSMLCRDGSAQCSDCIQRFNRSFRS